MLNIVPSELRWLYRYIRPFLIWHAASFVCITLGSVLALLNPLVLKWLIDRVFPTRNVPLLLGAVLMIFITYEGRAVLNSLGGYLTLQATQRTAFDLRLRLLRHVDSLSADYHETTAVGAKLYPFNDPIDQIAYFGSDLFPSILRTLLATVLTISAMMMLSPRLTLAVLPLIPTFLVTRRYFRRRLQQDSDVVQRNRTALSSFLQEHLYSAVQIQLLRQERRQERLAFRILAKTIRSQYCLAKTGAQFSIWTNMAIVLAMSSIIGYGGWSVISGSLTIGGLVAFYTYLSELFDPLSGALETYSRAQRTFASIRQVKDCFELIPRVTDSPNAVALSKDEPLSIEVRQARFGYRRQKRLLQIPCLRILPGERVAIVGENGAGKSTIGKLLARVYDVESGAITIGGQDIRHIQLKSLRSVLCYIPQHPSFFDGTLATNLRFGKPSASDRELIDVIQTAELSPLLKKLPHGLDEWLGPGGSHLSGGEHQRLAIARALLQQPRILILDETTSSLDATAEQHILRKLNSALPHSTLIIISHRLSTVSWIDRILVLQAGEIVEDGDHQFLKSRNGVYSELFSARPHYH